MCDVRHVRKKTKPKEKFQMKDLGGENKEHIHVPLTDSWTSVKELKENSSPGRVIEKE